MAQHDYSIANQTGLQFRSDLNDALSAIVSNNSGTTEPTTKFAYQWWADTTLGILKIRNAANNAWIVIGALSGNNLVPVIPLGLVGTPGLYFEGDTNTGLYSSGADLLGITAGGAELLRADGVLGYLKFLGTKGVLIPSGTTAQRPTGVEGLFRYNSDNTRFEIYENSAWRDVVSASETQTLTNKTLTTPVVDILSVTDQSGTPSTPSSGTTKVYTKTDGKVYKLTSAGVEQEIGTGSSGGGINYNTNPDFETATTGYAAYADAPAAAPVDGTGGSPTTTITRTTSSALRGTASGLITKAASNLQGEGVGYAFTISSADQAKQMAITFDYAIASGTFAGGTDAAVGDLVLYIYDVTNAVLIQPAGYKILGSVSGQFYKHQATFQTASNSVSYRLIWHVATTSTSAWTFKFDNVQVGPQTISFGAPISDWTSFTPTGSWVANSTYTGKYRRIGDSMELQVGIALSGAPTSAALLINLPTGFSIDTSKIPGFTAAAGAPILGVGTAVHSSQTYNLQFNYQTSALIAYYQNAINGTQTTVTQAAPITFASGDSVQLTSFRIPILGWGSSVVLSNETDTRVVSFAAYRASSSQTASAGVALEIVPNTSRYDTHASFSTSTGRYTAPVSGYYRFIGGIQFTTGATAPSTISTYFLKNGAGDRIGNWTLDQMSTTKTYTANNVGTVFLNAGDYVSLWANSTTQAVTVQNSGSTNDVTYLYAERISGPSQVAAAEQVAASAYLSANQTGINTNNSTVKVVFNSVTPVNGVGFDTHGAFNTTLGRFVAPRNDKYRVSAVIEFLATNILANNYQAQIFVNGTYSRAGAYVKAQATTTFAIDVTGLFSLKAGDYVEVFIFGAGNNSASTITADTITYIEVESV